MKYNVIIKDCNIIGYPQDIINYLKDNLINELNNENYNMDVTPLSVILDVANNYDAFSILLVDMEDGFYKIKYLIEEY